MLGTFHGTAHFQLLSGINQGHQKLPYWQIFLPIMFLIPTTSISLIIYKKMKAKCKDRKLQQQVKINLNTQDNALKNESKNIYHILYEPEIVVGAKIICATFATEIRTSWQCFVLLRNKMATKK